MHCSQIVIAEPYTLPMSGSWPERKVIIRQNSERKEQLGHLYKTFHYKFCLTTANSVLQLIKAIPLSIRQNV